jgi:hypothetical protein
MSNPSKSFISVSRIVTDLMLVGPAFVFWTLVAKPSVPLTEPLWIWIGAAFTATPLTGVTWMAYHMLRVVYQHERAKKRGLVEE